MDTIVTPFSAVGHVVEDTSKPIQQIGSGFLVTIKMIHDFYRMFWHNDALQELLIRVAIVRADHFDS